MRAPGDVGPIVRSIVVLLAILALASGCQASSDEPAGDTGRASATATGFRSTAGSTVPPGLTMALVTQVVDGDTIYVEMKGEQRTVRYIGVDTPEVDARLGVECFGAEASASNEELVEGEMVGLEKDVSETDQYGRLLRYVWLGGEMVNSILVREGYAEAKRYPPDVRYQALLDGLEKDARASGAGQWGAECAETATPTPGSGGPGACEYSGTDEAVIKGNVSSSGEKIYHVPGQENYGATVVNETNGERWFCTEAEAEAAGWRKARR